MLDEHSNSEQSLRQKAFFDGSEFVDNSDYQKAIAAFEQALGEHGLFPSTLTILQSLAESYSYAQHKEAAFRTYLEMADLTTDGGSEWLEQAVAVLDYDSANSIMPWLMRKVGLKEDQPDLGCRELPPLTLILLAGVSKRLKQPQRTFDLLKSAALQADEKDRQTIAEKLYELATDSELGDREPQPESILRSAVEICPSHQFCRWALSNVLRIKSYGKKPPYLITQHIQEALQVWEDANARQTAPEPWPLSIRGLINEQLAKVSNADRWQLGWQEVCLLFRAILLTDTAEGAYHASLGRAFRDLGLWEAEDYYTAKAIGVDSEELAPKELIEERIITLTNSGRFEESMQLISAQREIQQLRWLDCIEAYVDVRLGRLHEALKKINLGLEESPDEWWYRGVKADCLRELGDIPAMLVEYERLRATSDPSNQTAALTYARACYWIEVCHGSIDVSENVFREYNEKMALPTEAEPLFGLAECHWLNADMDAAVTLLRIAVQRCTRTADLDEARMTIDGTLKLRRQLFGDPAASALADTARTLLQILDERRQELQSKPAKVIDELSKYARAHRNQENACVSDGARAALGAVYTDDGRFEEALAVYQELVQSEQSLVPEARSAFSTLETRIRAQLDEKLSSDDASEAVRLCNILIRYKTGMSAEASAFAYATLTSISAQAGDAVKAREYLLQAHNAYPSSWTLFSRLRSAIKDAAGLWTMYDLLAGSGLDGLPLLSWLGENQEYAAFAEPDRPITFELGNALIPEDTSMNWSLFRRYIPEMRGRVKDEWGVTLPGISVRSNTNLPSNGFTVLLGSVLLPIFKGTVDLEPPESPSAGRGMEEANSVQDPILPAVQHLERVLVDRLDQLLTFDAAQALIDELDPESKTPMTSRARFFFARLLRELLRERVPIARLAEIAETVRYTHLDALNLSAAVRAVRDRLGSRLPGNVDDWIRAPLPHEIEARFTDTARHDPIAAREELELLGEIRRFIADLTPSPQRVALLASNYGVATAVRRLIHDEIPDVEVLCSRELPALFAQKGA